MSTDKTERSALIDLIEERLTAVYHCTREWFAWQVGTMTEEDFVEALGTDLAPDIADAILARRAAQPTQPATVVPVAEIVTFGGLDGQKEVSWSKGKMPPLGTKLYAHPSAPAESGWQWVPVKPTQEMVKAAMQRMFDEKRYNAPWEDVIDLMYRSMLKAAPSAAQPGGEGGAT
jgi:hypothetical protein